MRLCVTAAMLLALGVSPALAQREPQIVVPGRPDVPVIINGVDASWGVVEGEFGLDRPGMVAPTVIYRPLQVAVPYNVPGFFPRSDKKPGYGRLEVVPPPGTPPPPPAPTYFRSWSSQSAPGPVTDYPPYPMPPIVVQPNFGHGRDGHDGHDSKGGKGKS
jgi:hypothetical protein